MSKAYLCNRKRGSSQYFVCSNLQSYYMNIYFLFNEKLEARDDDDNKSIKKKTAFRISIITKIQDANKNKIDS